MSKKQVIRLGDAATFINGMPFKPTDWDIKGLPIIRIQNLTGSSDEINFYSGEYNLRYEITDGDVLISWSASLGVYIWEKGKAILNQHIFKVVFDKVEFDKVYFKYAVSQKLDEMALMTHGSTMKHITKGYFDNVEIHYPPIEVQKKIAVILDKSSYLISLRKKQIEKLDLLVKAKFVDMFGDPFDNRNCFEVVQFEKCINYIGDIGSNGANETISANLKMSDKEDYALMVRTLNFTANDFTKNVKYVSKDVYDFFKKSQIFGGELIFNKIGSAGINFIMPYLNRPVSLGLNQIVVRIKDNVNMTYLYTLLNTEYGKYQINKRVQGAVTKSITKGEIKNIPIIIPPIELQNQFAEFVQQVDCQKAQMHQCLEKLELNYKALMQQYFG